MSKTLKQLVPGSITKVRGSNPRVEGSTPSQAKADLPDDLAALFAAAPETTDADRAQLEKAAEALHKDPEFIADHAKGLIIEDILRAMEVAGMTRNALATKIGKSRQYVSKILDEDRRVNFTIDSLAEFSAVLDLQLCLRMLPASERMLFIRRLAAPVEVAPADQFPDESFSDSAAPECEAFVPRNIIPFVKDDTYERTPLSA